MVYQAVIRDSDVIDGLSVRYLKIFGIWRVINDYRTTGKRNAIMKLELLLTIVFSLPLIVCQCLGYFVIKLDLQRATFLSLHLLPAVQICSKILVFWFRLDSMCRLYNLAKKDFLTIPEYKRAEVKDIYTGISKTSNTFSLAIFLVNGVGLVLCSTVPGVPIDYITQRAGAITPGGKMKVWGGWYPLPMAESPYYEAIYAYEAVLLAWGGLLLALHISLFFQVLMCLYAQFAVFGHHISSLKIDSVIPDRRNLSDHDCGLAMYNELHTILRDYKKLLSYADELRSVYNPLVTVVLGMGIIVLIVSVFQFLFGGSSDILLVYRFLIVLSYQSIEVCMFCFGSSCIEKASSDLQFAIYSSDWYKADTKFRKAAQMMMLRARKGETLTALKMYPVNMETIMAILQFTYSTATLLSRMME